VKARKQQEAAQQAAEQKAREEQETHREQGVQRRAEAATLAPGNRDAEQHRASLQQAAGGRLRGQPPEREAGLQEVREPLNQGDEDKELGKGASKLPAGPEMASQEAGNCFVCLLVQFCVTGPCFVHGHIILITYVGTVDRDMDDGVT